MTTDEQSFQRKLMEARYKLFDHFALEDQRQYYNKVVARNRLAARQVNFIRASCALMTIIVTAIATYFVQMRFTAGGSGNEGCVGSDCAALQTFVNTLLFFSVFFPAMGAFFNMLADLFQWDRLVKVYDEAVKGLDIPDSVSPNPKMPDAEYVTNLYAYVLGTLKVMKDETGQWGQLIKPSDDLEKFRVQAVENYEKLERSKLGKPQEIPKPPE